jgi:hypothetical protein
MSRLREEHQTPMSRWREEHQAAMSRSREEHLDTEHARLLAASLRICL